MAVILGNYEILNELASGGMGRIYEGIQLSLRRPVAIKELSLKLSSDPHFIARFEKEALGLGTMNCENIVGAFDFGKHDDSYFIVMEFVNGLDLNSFISKCSEISSNAALTIFEFASRGLAYAHGKNIIHRDIKPANIMLSKEGTVKITDFGLCRLTTEASDMTLSGAVMGTPRYMSPEQAMGKELDLTSDIYSLGLVFYELLTGLFAIEGQTVEELIKEQIYGKGPDLKLIPSETHKSLIKLLAKCIEKRPQDRYQDFGQVLYEIRKIRYDVQKYRNHEDLSDVLLRHNLVETRHYGDEDFTEKIKEIRKSAQTRGTSSSFENTEKIKRDLHWNYSGSIEDFDGEDYITNYNSIFLPQVDMHGCCDYLKSKKSMLFIGRPASGKSRLIAELLSMLKQDFHSWQLLILKQQAPENIEVLVESIESDKCILVWEDLNHYINTWDPSSLISMLKQKLSSLIIIGSLRSGSDFTSVELERSGWLAVFDRHLEIPDMRDEDALSLANAIGEDIGNFDGTPGSVLLGLAPLKAKYKSLKEPSREILQCIKLLNMINIVSPDRSLISVLLEELFDIELKSSSLRKAIRVLIDDNFIIRDDEGYSFYHKIYSDKIVTDYSLADLKEDLDDIVDILKDAKNVRHLNCLGSYLIQEKEFSILEQLSEFALELESESITSLKQLATAKLRLGERKKALEIVNRAIELAPTDFFIYEKRAMIYQSLERYEDALNDFEFLISFDENDDAVINNRGILYRLMGKHDLAIKDFNKAVELKPDIPVYHNNLAVTKYTLGDKEGAIKDWLKAIELNPNYEKPYMNIGYVKRLLKDYDGAEEYFEKAIKVSPTEPFPYINHANSMKIKKNYKKALEDYAHAYELLTDKTHKATVLSSSSLVYLILGDIEKAKSIFDEAEKFDEKAVRYNKLCFFSLMAKHDKSYLQKAFDLIPLVMQKKTVTKEWMRNDADLDYIRQFPEFEETLAKV